MKAGPLTETERSDVRRLVDTIGLPRTAAKLAIAEGTAARVVAGLPIQRGTAALVRARLAADSNPPPRAA